MNNQYCIRLQVLCTRYEDTVIRSFCQFHGIHGTAAKKVEKVKIGLCRRFELR